MLTVGFVVVAKFVEDHGRARSAMTWTKVGRVDRLLAETVLYEPVGAAARGLLGEDASGCNCVTVNGDLHGEILHSGLSACKVW